MRQVIQDLKLCIFPNDPLISYYKKKEIKERYFNPENIFSEIHVISFTDKDVDESLVQDLAGSAKLNIHSVGKINLKNYLKNQNRIKSLVKEISPDIIRTYNPLLAGWFAATCSDELKIPLFVSLHTQYDQLRKISKKYDLKRYLTLKYTEKFLEPFVLKKANKITIAYRIIEPYVMKRCRSKPELLYNRINCKRFADGIPIQHLKKPLVISVGQLIEEKNHRCIIDAMKDVKAHCLIIGNGELYNELIGKVKEMKLEERIIIKKSVPHHEIQNYYKSADVFALAYDPELEGLPIPVMEAMAAGLPVIIPFPKKGYSDGLEGVALFSERTPSAFACSINNVLMNPDLRKDRSQKSLNKSLEFNYSIIEKRESEIYIELLHN